MSTLWMPETVQYTDVYRQCSCDTTLACSALCYCSFRGRFWVAPARIRPQLEQTLLPRLKGGILKITTTHNRGRVYADQWHDLRVRICTFWGTAFGGFILLGAFGNLAHGALPWLVVLWMILGTVTGGRINLFRCPRCQDLLFRSRPWEKDWPISDITNPFRRHCPHCGLRKWANED